MEAFVHSIESLGTLDGPGIRLVIFLQGCPLRCLYCHNPDTWQTNTGKKMSVDYILKEYNKNKEFYKNGGITLTGGEPLIQIDFLIELFKRASELNIHTCLDTSGITFNYKSKDYMKKIDELLKYTDLVLLDIKEIDSNKHKTLTSVDNERILEFAKYLSIKNIDVWIRHVVIPNITDNKVGWLSLGYFLGGLNNIKSLDVLPYHTMGVSKYKELGMTYKLEGTKNASEELAKEARDYIIIGMKKRKKEILEKKR